MTKYINVYTDKQERRTVCYVERPTGTREYYPRSASCGRLARLAQGMDVIPKIGINGVALRIQPRPLVNVVDPADEDYRTESFARIYLTDYRTKFMGAYLDKLKEQHEVN